MVLPLIRIDLCQIQPHSTSAPGHVWTAPWQELSDVSAAWVGCGQVPRPVMRPMWPLALMLCADRVSIHHTHSNGCVTASQISPSVIHARLLCFRRVIDRNAHIRSDRISFRLFIIFALVVARDRHQRADSNDEGEECQNGGLYGIEIFPPIFAHGSAPPAEKVANICREPLRYERGYENNKRAVRNAAHTNGLSASGTLIDSKMTVVQSSMLRRPSILSRLLNLWSCSQ
jgi:hypothetical protein